MNDPALPPNMPQFIPPEKQMRLRHLGFILMFAPILVFLITSLLVFVLLDNTNPLNHILAWIVLISLVSVLPCMVIGWIMISRSSWGYKK